MRFFQNFISFLANLHKKIAKMSKKLIHTLLILKIKKQINLFLGIKLILLLIGKMFKRQNL